MKNINELYEELIKPKNFIKQFEDDEAFKAFLRIDFNGEHKKDLESILETFTKDGLHYHCGLIRQVIIEIESIDFDFCHKLEHNYQDYKCDKQCDVCIPNTK